MQINEIEKLILPIVERQRAVNTYILQLLMRRVRELLKHDADYTKIAQNGSSDISNIKTYLKGIRRIQAGSIKTALTGICKTIYSENEYLYEYRKLKQPNLLDSDFFWEVLAPLIDDCLEECCNYGVSNSIGYVYNDSGYPTSIYSTYYEIVNDYANLTDYQRKHFNLIDIKRLENLINGGLKYITTGDTGQLLQTDLASHVELSIYNTINQLNKKIQEKTASDTNCDGVEISVHIDCAADHEPIQGHQFSIEEFNKLQSNVNFKDIHGNSFLAIKRGIGMWNCRHLTRSIIIGVSKPDFTDEQLDAIIKRNHAGIKLNDKQITIYEGKQILAQYEAKINTTTTALNLSKVLNNDTLINKYQTQLNNYKLKYEKLDTILKAVRAL